MYLIKNTDRYIITDRLMYAYETIDGSKMYR